MPKYKSMDELADAILDDVAECLGDDVDDERYLQRYKDPDKDAHECIYSAVDAILETPAVLEGNAWFVIAHEMGWLDEVLGKHVEFDKLDEYLDSLDSDEYDRIWDEVTHHPELNRGIDEVALRIEDDSRWEDAIDEQIYLIVDAREYRAEVERYYDSTRL